uniref:ABC-type nitrate/sulfonate/bicarbonate transport systems periplasmic components-like protein n=1 Tax=Cereibacter sphaeroides (strain ATCC 17025 / ATH 2.4.3) TaxID=349102 RepID=A4WQJ3_CERS5
MKLPGLLAALAAALLSAGGALAEDDAKVIRIGFPGVGADSRPYGHSTVIPYARAREILEKEFASDGIEVIWTFFRGAGPALNEATAAGQLDFFLLGDLPAIVGRANGLKHRFIFATGRNDPIYLAVPEDSDIETVEDVKGRKVALFKGTNLQNATDRILERHGLTERDVRFVNLDANSAVAALTSGNVDAVFGGQEYLALAEKGVVKIAYTTKGDDPTLGRNSSFLVTDAFAEANPGLTQRVVTTLIEATALITKDENRDEAFDAWTLSGFPKSTFEANFDGVRLSQILNPLIDDYVVARYTEQVAAAKAYGLLRNDVDVDGWFDRTYLDVALKELGLEHFWSRRGANGETIEVGTNDAAANPTTSTGG